MNNIVVYDFTNVFNWFFTQILNIIRYCYVQMDSITIGGVSFLDISVTIVILGAILPIVFTFASNSVSASRGYAINEKKNSYSTYKKNRSRSSSYAKRYKKGE